MKKKMIGRSLCLVLLTALVLSLAGCSDKAAVALSGAGVSKGVFAYYLDRVLASPESYALPAEPSKAEAVDAAVKLCSEHIAVSSLCRERDYRLSNSEKSAVATETENYWGMFSDYYEKLGIEKQDLTLIKENEAKRTMLIEKLYGADGEKPVKESEIVKAFNSTHVGFRAITGYFTEIDEQGNEVPCSEEKKQEIREAFQEMAEKINDGDDIEDLNKEYNESQGLSGPEKLSVIVTDNTDTTYSSDFYKNVKKLETGKAAVIELENYIYVILRADISSKKYVNAYRRQILEYLKNDDVNKLIDERIEPFGDVKTHSTGSVYSAVSKIKKEGSKRK